MPESTKTIPEITETSTVQDTDSFIVRIQSVTIPKEVTWATMLEQALTAIPESYYHA